MSGAGGVGVRAASAGTMGGNSSGLQDTLSHKSVIEKQRAAIRKLREQNHKLKEELLLENKFSVQPSTQAAATLISRLQDEADLFTRKIELEKRKVAMLDQQLEEVNTKLTGTRRKMGGINSAKEASVTVQKQMTVLENRLEKAYIKFNEAITHNKQLREQIDNMRRERMMFENISATLERELVKLKKEMAEVIEHTNTAYEAKERALAEMAVLKVQSDKEHQSFEKEWRLLTAEIEEDRKARDRQRMDEMAERERKTQELLKKEAATAQLKKKSLRGQWNAASKSVMAQNVAMERVQQYGAAFEKIQQATGIKDIDELVNTFLDAEDHNYTLFNYVNEVNMEIEKLEDQIVAIKAEIEKYKGEGIESDNARKKALKDVEERLHKTEARADLYEKRYEASLKVAGMLKASIWNIFNKIGCNTAAVREMLGDAGVTDSNILAFLGVVEQRTSELLTAHTVRRAGEEAAVELLTAQPLPASTVRVIIEPPSTQVEEEEEEGIEVDQDDEKPMTRETLESRINRTIGRKIETSIKFKPIHPEGGPKKGKK